MHLLITISLSVTAIAGPAAPAGEGFQQRRENVPPVSRAQKHAVQAAAKAELDHAILFKPPQDGPGLEQLLVDLAPLIVRRVDPSQDTEQPAPGRPEKLIVYAGSSTLKIRGGDYKQVVYFWCYDCGAIEAARRYQGIRITLGQDGFPLAWEVLASWDGLRRVFASNSLESAAAERFGGTLPGRDFAVEPGAEDAGNIIVVDIFEDGPVPMGPYVYVNADLREVTTLLCRCSPSQVNHFVESVNYSLKTLDEFPDSGSNPAAAPDALSYGLRWPFGP